MFNKDTELFPSTRSSYFLSHCAVSPLYRDAAHAMHEFNEKMAHLGLTALDSFADLLPRYRRGFGTLLKTEASNISYTHTTAEAMNQIAWGYPFAPGDRIISYRHEYPSNHYPWLLQRIARRYPRSAARYSAGARFCSRRKTKRLEYG
jgi:cysteine desulfurase/selenocysteine lyase